MGRRSKYSLFHPQRPLHVISHCCRNSELCRKCKEKTQVVAPHPHITRDLPSQAHTYETVSPGSVTCPEDNSFRTMCFLDLHNKQPFVYKFHTVECNTAAAIIPRNFTTHCSPPSLPRPQLTVSSAISFQGFGAATPSAPYSIYAMQASQFPKGVTIFEINRADVTTPVGFARSLFIVHTLS